jgi:NADPH-dependent 2,4-dienoyl-CoA reductase/sulfur reductase-like enzyme/rhodanese-related sulfurtransferase
MSIVRIVIIGAVAAGTSAAAKARRNNEEAEIVIYEKDSFISYSGCGMPYFIGGEVKSADELAPRNPAFFKSKYNIDILIKHEVLAINAGAKTIEVKNLSSGEIFTDRYDKLIISTGASPNIPKIKGADIPNVFKLRSISDMELISAYIAEKHPKKAVIIGSGFIGLEMCENLSLLGIEVTLIEMLPQVIPVIDADMSVYVSDHLKKNKVNVMTGVSATEIAAEGVRLSNGHLLDTGLVLISTGVHPNTELARKAGIELGIKGAIKVDKKMRTNIEDIYACGDCTEQFNIITGKPIYHPLGSTANKTGRIAGDSVTGGSLEFKGVLGTGIFKIFDMVVANTGITEKEAVESGFDIVAAHNTRPNKPEYMGGREMVIKCIADKKTGRILGAQIVGYEGVDKRLDVLATAITFGAKAEDLFHLDLGYAPPFSTARDPVAYTGMILDNAINKGRPLITAQTLNVMMESQEDFQLIDARTDNTHKNKPGKNPDKVKKIPLSRLRDELKTMDKEKQTVVYCNRGITANAAQNILLNNGFKDVYNLSGGNLHYNRLFPKKPLK